MGKSIVFTPATIGMFFVLAFCWGMQNLHRSTFGPFLEWLANLGINKDISFVHIHIHPFTFAHTINKTIQQVLSQGLALAEKSFVRLLNMVVEPYLLLAGVTLALGLTGYEGLRALWNHVTHVVPRVIVERIKVPAKAAARQAVGISQAMFSTLAHRVSALAAHVAHIAATIPHASPQVIPRLGRLEKTRINYDKLHKWINRALLGTLGATAVWAALRILKLRWIRCETSRKFGNRLCGAHPQWLSDFLAGMTVIVGATSVVEFIEEAQAGEELALDLLQGFVRELKGLDLDRAAAAANGFATITDLS